MRETMFEVGDKVHIPVDMPVTEKYQGAQGTVIEVYPGTGPGARFVGQNERLEWSTGPDYLIDFGLPIGTQRIDQAILKADPDNLGGNDRV